MACIVVTLLLKRNIGVSLGVLRGPRKDVPLFSLLCFCIVVMSGYFLFAVFYIHSPGE
jgi:hypothetical protein